jgi:hypothetical protein
MKPLIFSAAWAALSSDPSPSIRAVCSAAAGAKDTLKFRQAVAANLNSPAAILRAVKALKTKRGTATATNAARLLKAMRSEPTQAAMNAARLSATFRKSTL